MNAAVLAFADLMVGVVSRGEVVVAFLAMLELVKNASCPVVAEWPR
ncbi:MAG: hypothetical protein R2864_12175 [Syntrophotaleaceae bacterium]